VPVSRQEMRSIMAHFETASRGGRCHECGYDWTLSVEDARGIVAGAPARCAELIGDRWEEARAKPDARTWSPSGYVWHMADAIGIWSERLAALASDPGSPLVGFDQDDLADVRGYDRLSPIAGVWAFERRVRDWNEALGSHPDPDRSLEHPDFGAWTIAAVIRWMGHDLFHHLHDIERIMGPAGAR
jgi:hypothetical protein